MDGLSHKNVAIQMHLRIKWAICAFGYLVSAFALGHQLSHILTGQYIAEEFLIHQRPQLFHHHNFQNHHCLDKI